MGRLASLFTSRGETNGPCRGSRRRRSRGSGSDSTCGSGCDQDRHRWDVAPGTYHAPIRTPDPAAARPASVQSNARSSGFLPQVPRDSSSPRQPDGASSVTPPDHHEGDDVQPVPRQVRHQHVVPNLVARGEVEPRGRSAGDSPVALRIRGAQRCRSACSWAG
jgi:hypothetical protein